MLLNGGTPRWIGSIVNPQLPSLAWSSPATDSEISFTLFRPLDTPSENIEADGWELPHLPPAASRTLATPASSLPFPSC